MRNIWIICRKELRSYFVSPVAYLLLVMFALIFGFFFWNALGYFVLMGMESQMRGQDVPMNLNEQIVRPLLSNVGVVGLFFIPLISMRLFAEEKRNGTIELLTTSPIRDVEIIVGKWLAAVVLYACLLAITAVNFLFLFKYGNPDWKPLAIGYLGLLLQGGSLLAIGTFIVYVLIVITAVVVTNVLANRYDKSYDGTANKRYSLSEQTKKIVRELNQDATIRYFDQATRYNQAKDLLDQYASLSPKIHVEYVDPDKNPEVAREAGIKNYGTAVLEIGSKKEEAKSLTEEGITGAFIRTLKGKTRTVCFVTGSGEHQIDDSDRNGYSAFKDLLSKDEYESKSINLLQKAEIPGDCTVVVVAGPTGDYQQPQVDVIKKYIEDGGRAFLMLDAPLKMGREIADNDALTNQLQSWGISLKKDLVLDLNPVGQLMGLGPQVALVSNYDSHAIVNPLKGTATGFPFSRSLDVKNGDKTTVEKLFSSSESSVATTNLHSTEIDPSDPKNTKGPLVIGAAGSYNTGKENVEGRFVVLGSSFWAANSFISFNGNRDLALNAMNWLSSDEDLISIRPKEQDDRRITMTQSQFSWVRATSQFLLPLAVLIVGASVWWRRR